jgi:diamine N-acetyltransferase
MKGDLMIEGKLVRLRAPEEADFEPYFRFLSRAPDWGFIDIYGPVPRKLAREQFDGLARPFEEVRTIWLTIDALGDGRPVGNVDIGHVDPVFRRASLGIAIWDPQDRRRGFAREALALALEQAFDRLDLHRLEATIDPANAASLALFEGAGFTREGVRRESTFYGGARHDEVWLGLLAPEWRGRRRA